MNGFSCHAGEFDFILKIKRSQFLKDRLVLLGECFGEEQDQRQEKQWRGNAVVYIRGNGGLN